MAVVNYKSILKRLQTIWMVCYGTLAALIAVGYFVPHIWLPLVAVLLILPLMKIADRNMGSTPHAHCSLMTHYTAYILLISGIIMLGINVLNSRMLGHLYPHLVNPRTPFVPSLVVFPVATAMYALALLRRNKTEYCKTCRQRAGYSIKETLEGNVFHSEAKLMIIFSLAVSAILTVEVLLYYFMFYINVNINDSDAFFLYILPVAVYLLGCFYVYSRYETMVFEINMAPGTSSMCSMVRFLVLRKGELLLAPIIVHEQPTGLWDTPAVTTVGLTEELSDEEARELFIRLSGTQDFYLRRLFVTNTASHNAFHFIAILDQDDTEVPSLDGDWFNLYDVHALMKQGHTSRPFAYEIHRIYTITMAWKTYDRNGKRRYPIKNYRPTFRLVDLKEWTVDYSDMHWMAVARNNEDRPLWKLRRFWRRYISKVDKR